jgi:hypothetical protein
MKFYASLMIIDEKLPTGINTEWVEITDSQHTKIMNILLNNKKLGAETRVIP